MDSNNKLSFYQIMWLYIIGAFLGFIGETLFHIYSHGEFSNMQGMVYGPFKPLYGLGAVIMYLIYRNVSGKRYLFVIFSGIFVGTLYEYGVSLFEENVFGYNSWLYSDGPLVINRRVYLPYCFIWGLIILFYYLAIPYIKRFYNYLCEFDWFKRLSFVACFLMCFNILLTIGVSARYVDRSNGVDAKTVIGNTIDVFYDDEFVKEHLPLIKIKK